MKRCTGQKSMGATVWSLPSLVRPRSSPSIQPLRRSILDRDNCDPRGWLCSSGMRSQLLFSLFAGMLELRCVVAQGRRFDLSCGCAVLW
jgi:hypothetical protein